MKKQQTQAMSRRQFLRGSSAGVGLGAILASGVAPFLWTSRKTYAAPTGNLTLAGGAIFFVLNGGARTQGVFNGSVGLGTNPFGQMTGLTVPLSAVLQGTGLDNDTVNRQINFLTTCQHHNRTGSHNTGRVVACTGFRPEEEKPGILTILNHALPFRSIPCVNIGSDTPTTRVGTEIPSTFVPIKLSRPTNVSNLVDALASTQVSPAEMGRLDNLRYTLSDRFLRGTTYKQPADIPAFQRKAAEVAQQLDKNALDITNTGASLGTYVGGGNVDNATLRTAFGVNNGNSLGEKAMLALRLRQIGCPGISLSTGNWDLHSNERTRLPGKAFEVGQAMAALIDQMARIPDSLDNLGRSLLDTTIITVVTDFNRGNWNISSGFNGNNGSDHRSNRDKTSMQCIPIIGGGLPGSKVLGEMTGNGSPTTASPVYETRQVLATVLDLIGIPSENYFPGINPISRELLA